MKVRDKILKLGFKAILLLVVATNVIASDFKVSRAIEVEIISISSEISKIIVPIVRPFVSQDGHIAAVDGADLLVIADHPASLKKLIPILSSLDKYTFDPNGFKLLLTKTLVNRHKKNQITRVFKLKNITAKSIIPSIRMLVSRTGSVVADARTNQITITDLPDYLPSLGKIITLLDSNKDI